MYFKSQSDYDFWLEGSWIKVKQEVGHFGHKVTSIKTCPLLVLVSTLTRTDDKIIHTMLSQQCCPKYSSSVPRMFFPFHDYNAPTKDVFHLYLVRNNSYALVYHRIN